MKTLRCFFLPFLAVLGLACFAHPAHALTAEELAGVYNGTATVTSPNGKVRTITVTVTFKAKGNLKMAVTTANGLTTPDKGKFHFVSDDVIVGALPDGEFTAFVATDGQVLSLALLSKEFDDGSSYTERLTATLSKKL